MPTAAVPGGGDPLDQALGPILTSAAGTPGLVSGTTHRVIGLKHYTRSPEFTDPNMYDLQPLCLSEDWEVGSLFFPGQYVEPGTGFFVPALVDQGNTDPNLSGYTGYPLAENDTYFRLAIRRTGWFRVFIHFFVSADQSELSYDTTFNVAVSPQRDPFYATFVLKWRGFTLDFIAGRRIIQGEQATASGYREFGFGGVLFDCVIFLDPYWYQNAGAEDNLLDVVYTGTGNVTAGTTVTVRMMSL